MKLSSSIYRILLTLLLLSSSLTGSASSARSGNEVHHSSSTAAYYDKAADVQEERYHAPQDAVLSGNVHLSGTASLQTGYVHGGDGGLTVYGTPSSLLSSPTAGYKMQLRRWRLKASAVRQEQLTALYPAHAFW